MKNFESIEGVAIRVKQTSKVFSLPFPAIHSDLCNVIPMTYLCKKLEYGFITNKGKFVGRTRAAEIIGKSAPIFVEDI